MPNIDYPQSSGFPIVPVDEQCTNSSINNSVDNMWSGCQDNPSTRVGLETKSDKRPHDEVRKNRAYGEVVNGATCNIIATGTSYQDSGKGKLYSELGSGGASLGIEGSSKQYKECASKASIPEGGTCERREKQQRRYSDVGKPSYPSTHRERRHSDGAVAKHSTTTKSSDGIFAGERHSAPPRVEGLHRPKGDTRSRPKGGNRKKSRKTKHEKDRDGPGAESAGAPEYHASKVFDGLLKEVNVMKTGKRV